MERCNSLLTSVRLTITVFCMTKILCDKLFFKTNVYKIKQERERYNGYQKKRKKEKRWERLMRCCFCGRMNKVFEGEKVGE